MAKTESLCVRIEPQVKQQAEAVLDKLGIPMSNAINLFLQQVVWQKGIPFDVKLPEEKPLSYGNLTEAEFDAVIEKGFNQVKNGQVVSARQVKENLKNEFGIDL